MSLRRSTKDPIYCNPFGLNSVTERVSQDCSLNDASTIARQQGVI